MNWTMTYNSAKEQLIIPEYGRHVQLLVEHAKTVEDADQRQRLAERIIRLMMQMQPQTRNLDDYKERLWKHLFRISNYELDVNPPKDVNTAVKTKEVKALEKVPYPKFESRFRHYGHNVQLLIKEALEMPEGPKRNGFMSAIAAYMKLAYKTWNRDHYVSDEVIKADLASLSEGKLIIPDDQSLNNLGGNKSGGRSNNRKKSGKNNSGGSNKRSGSNYGSRGRRSNNTNSGGRRNYKK